MMLPEVFMIRKRPTYTPEFKAEAIRLAHAGDKSIGQVGKDLVLLARVGGEGGVPVGPLTAEERQELQRLRRENARLQMERDFPKKSSGLLRQGAGMKFKAIQAEKASYPIALMCACLSVSRSGYYAWESRPESPRALQDKVLAGEVEKSFQASRQTYGYPRIYRDLQNKGHQIGRHRTARLMPEKGLRSVHHRRFRVTTTQADPSQPAGGEGARPPVQG